MFFRFVFMYICVQIVTTGKEQKIIKLLSDVLETCSNLWISMFCYVSLLFWWLSTCKRPHWCYFKWLFVAYNFFISILNVQYYFFSLAMYIYIFMIRVAVVKTGATKLSFWKMWFRTKIRWPFNCSG